METCGSWGGWGRGRGHSRVGNVVKNGRKTGILVRAEKGGRDGTGKGGTWGGGWGGAPVAGEGGLGGGGGGKEMIG